MRNDAKAPNYFGIGGAVLAAMGMFMPLEELWGFQVTLAEGLQQEGGAFLPLAIILLVAAGVLFFRGRTEGRWFGVGLLIAFLALVFAETGESSSSGFDAYVGSRASYGYGFGVILIGLGLMIAAPTLKSKVEEFKYTNIVARPVPSNPTAPTTNSVVPGYWSCPACKNVNSETTNVCFVCKRKRLACPSCGKIAVEGKKFCDQCGTMLIDPAREERKKSIPLICPVCGTTCTVGSLFCSECGADLVKLAELQKEKAEREEREKKEAAHRKEAFLKCPICGKETLKENERCEHCNANLKAPFVQIEGELTDAYVGSWTGDTDSNGIPRQELTISSIEDGALTFDLIGYAAFKIRNQSAKLVSKKEASFHTSDGTNVTGTIYLNGDNVIVYFEDSGISFIEAGETYQFFSKSESRQL